MKYKSLILLILTSILIPSPVLAEKTEYRSVEVTLADCVDGDTAWFNIDGKRTKTRFLAIDTKETVHPTKEVEAWGKDASEFTCNKLKKASKIILEYDPSSTKTDKYNRDLVWVFVEEELLQESLVEVGYAEVKYIYGDYLYTDRLKEVEAKAKEQKIGIWSTELTNIKPTSSEEDTKSSNIIIDPWIVIVLIIGFMIIILLPKKYQTKAKKILKKLKKI